jgi:hypothetical protein
MQVLIGRVPDRGGRVEDLTGRDMIMEVFVLGPLTPKSYTLNPKPPQTLNPELAMNPLNPKPDNLHTRS